MYLPLSQNMIPLGSSFCPFLQPANPFRQLPQLCRNLHLSELFFGGSATPAFVPFVQLSSCLFSAFVLTFIGCHAVLSAFMLPSQPMCCADFWPLCYVMLSAQHFDKRYYLVRLFANSR